MQKILLLATFQLKLDSQNSPEIQKSTVASTRESRNLKKILRRPSRRWSCDKVPGYQVYGGNSGSIYILQIYLQIYSIYICTYISILYIYICRYIYICIYIYLDLQMEVSVSSSGYPQLSSILLVGFSQKFSSSCELGVFSMTMETPKG